MLPITQKLLTPNKFSRPGMKIKPKGIVIHWTANEGRGANAMGNRNFFEDRKAGKTSYGSAHYLVDDKSIILAVPETEMAYHVGSETYTQEALTKWGSYPNNCLIGIEICVNSDGDFNETLWNTIQLTADICRRYGLNPQTAITTHKAVVGWKDCPAFYVNANYCQKYFGTTDYQGKWNAFISAVKNVLNPPKPEEALKLFTDIMNHWAKGEIEDLKNMGIISGKTDTTFDPDAPITRAETAVVVRNAIRYITGK